MPSSVSRGNGPGQSRYRCCTSRKIRRFLPSVSMAARSTPPVRSDDGEGTEMTASTKDTTQAGQELKAKHRAMWALGDYPALVDDIIADLGPVLVRACRIRPGDRVLDVAAG